MKVEKLQDILSNVWIRDWSADDAFDEIDPHTNMKEDVLLDILSKVWMRDYSVDDALDLIDLENKAWFLKQLW